MSIDQWLRLYYDPVIMQKWSAVEISGVLYHEISHFLRDHAGRMRNYNPKLANVANDLEINDDLIAEGVVLPSGAITPQRLGMTPGLFAEEYLQLLTSQSAQPSGDDSSDDSATHTKGGSDGAGDATGDGGKDAGASESDGDAESDDDGTSSVDDTTQESDDEITSSENETTQESDTPHVGAGRCGSCATGHQESWEDSAPNEDNAPGVSNVEADIIRHTVAQDILNQSSAYGSVPGYLRRWAESTVSPKVDWRRELGSVMRRTLADTAGATDYSYRRPSRRGQPDGVVLPSLRRPALSVAVVVDTSGSIDDKMLAQALGEIRSILRGTGQRDTVTVLACDHEVHACRTIFRVEQVSLLGGGGTDMGVGISEAMQLRPRPDVIVVITDGYTPWPSTPPKGPQVVVVLLSRGSSPEWARTIRTAVA
jgi:predicted metal-dependent peptidase